MVGTGSVVVSLDTELEWGIHNTGSNRSMSTDGAEERKNIWELLQLFNELDAPATWAIVGHLFLFDCDGQHSDILSPNCSKLNWYTEDPGTDVKDASLRYAPDLVQAIATAGPDHEIASHTFSHVVADDPSVSPAVLRSELEECLDLASEQGYDLSTLVFPRNEVHYRDVVADLGFQLYRKKSPARRLVEGSVTGSVRRYLRFLTGRPAPIVEPKHYDNGLWGLPASQRLSYNPGSERLNESFSTHPRVKIARNTIEAVSRQGGIYHLWDHPHAFTPEMFRDLRQILETARRKGVPIMTMREALERNTQTDCNNDK